ncbi:hypothetical protein GCM10010191_01690 [Actinomadura vinacea]|uniref:Uncharacterized protein n=1 Tax=Actinomadura vinacea TaxID=115336 RepID=A0ABP5VBC2_9ACTN
MGTDVKKGDIINWSSNLKTAIVDKPGQRPSPLARGDRPTRRGRPIPPGLRFREESGVRGPVPAAARIMRP